MFKQILSRLPRRSSRSDPIDYASSNSGNTSQRAGNGNVASATRSNTVKRMSSVVFPASVVTGIEPLRLFRDVPNSERPSLFISKLNLCCEVFDFDDPNKNSAKKDIKSQMLLEVVDFVVSGSPTFTEAVVAAICRMCAANLFRTFPPNYRRNAVGGSENEEEEPMFEPAWAHLQIVYDLLLRSIASSSFEVKVWKKYIDHCFILKLLDLFDSEDPRERDCLKTILHRIYGKFMVHRPFIRKSISNIFYRFVFETDRHNGVAELLEILGSVISGFTLPLKEEHKMFLERALIPLHKPKSMGTYQQQLTFCVVQFVEKDPNLASMVLRGLLKFWPITNSQKELIFLGELEEVLEATNMVEFQKCVVPLFQRIRCCLCSSHFQVAERALYLWNNDHIISLIAPNRHVILPLVFPALENNTRSHWNQAVLNLTLNVRKLFSEMDEELFDTCQSNLENEHSKLRDAEEKRRLAWERLESIAVVGADMATGKTPVLAPPPTATTAAVSIC